MVVYDFDEILRPYDFSEEWEFETLDQMIRVADENAKEGRSSLVLGLIRPTNLKRAVDKVGFGLSVRYCLLEVDIDCRKKRLRARGADEKLIEDIEEYEQLPQQLAFIGEDYFKIDTSKLKVESVAKSIKDWIVEKSKD